MLEREAYRTQLREQQVHLEKCFIIHKEHIKKIMGLR